MADDIEAYVGNFKNRDIVETDGDGNIVKTVKSANKVKIRHLLAHSGGIYDKDKEKMPDLQSAVEHYKKYALRIFDAGQNQSYDISMCAYELLAYIAEKVTGIAFKDFVKENILIPLKMMDTTFLSDREQWDRDFVGRVDEMKENADVVVVFGGTNDFGHGDAEIGDFNSRSEYTFYGGMHSLCMKLLNKYPIDDEFLKQKAQAVKIEVIRSQCADD